MDRTWITMVLAAAMLVFASPATVTSAPAMTPERELAIVDNVQLAPAVAADPIHDTYLVVWQNVWPGNQDIWATLIDASGHPLLEFAVAFGGNDYASPDVAFDPVNQRFLVVWIYDSPGDGTDWDLWGRFIPWFGPDPAQVEFPISTSTTHQLDPAVAFGPGQVPEEFMVAWEDVNASVVSTITGQRVVATGGLQGAPFVIATGAQRRSVCDIAANHRRNEYIVVYQRQYNPTDHDVIAIRLAGNGSVFPPGEFEVAAWSSDEYAPAVAASPWHSTDGQFLVVWNSYDAGVGTRIYGRFVEGGTSAVDGAPVAFDWSGLDGRFPAIADDPGRSEYLVVWEQTFPATNAWGIVGQRIGTDHVLHDGAFGLHEYGPGENGVCAQPAAAAGRAGDLAVWTRDRSATTFVDVHGRVVWQLFADGFEDGDPGAWSSVVP